MSNRVEDAEAANRSAPDAGAESSRTSTVSAGWWNELRLAAGFLTILPVLPTSSLSSSTVARSFRWFPLIGFAIGATLAAENKLLAPLFGNLLAAALVVFTLCLLTGAVHLDALADVADALGAGRDRHRALTIMRDSRIGSFGATAIGFLLLLKAAALGRIGEGGVSRSLIALWLAPGLARWAMVAVSWRLDYLRTEGAGATLLSGDGTDNLVFASLLAVAGIIPVLSQRVLVAGLVAVGMVAMLRIVYRRWVGGITGDLAGAAGELVELAVLLVIAAR